MLVPQDTGPWLGPLSSTSDIGNTGACLHPRRVPGPGKPGARLVSGGLDSVSGIDLLPQRLPRLRHRLLPWGLLAPAASCAATSSPATPTTATLTTAISRTASLTTATRLDIGTKGYYPHEQLVGFSSHSIRDAAAVYDAPTAIAGGCQPVGFF